MMFSGTMPEEAKAICRKFMNDQIEVIVEDNSNLVLHGLDQYYINLVEKKKIEILLEILKKIPYSQLMCFCNSKDRATMLSKVCADKEYPNICCLGAMDQETRLKN